MINNYNDLYSEKYIVKSSDVCDAGYLKISRMFDALHDSLNNKLKPVNYDRDSLYKRGLLWVLGEQTAEITNLPKADDDISIYCWIGNEFMTFFPVFYEIHDSNSNVLVKVSSVWAIIDKDSREKKNPLDYNIDLGIQKTGNEISVLNTPRHLDINGESEYTVAKHNLDFNNHMNNAQYFDIIDDINPIISQNKMPRQVITRYAHEAFLDDVLNISWGSSDNSIFYSIDNNNSNCMKVRIEY